MKKLLLLIFISITLFANNLTEEEKKEAQQGTEYFEEILKKVTLSKDKKTLKRIKDVGQKLAKVVNKDYDWEFVLVEDKALNAFCLPGGKVVFYTGIFDVIDNDDQVATVMSHEIAHVLLRHGGMKGKADAILNIPKEVGKGLLGDLIPKNLHGVLDTVHEAGKQLTVMMPYGRHQETEADKLGVQIMKEAGYNPKEAIQLWKNIKKVSDDELPDFLSTHPNHDDRIKTIEEEIKGS
jgi:predicted Zn-dependent protease